MKAIYLERIYGPAEAIFNDEPATVTVEEVDAERETATLNVYHDGVCVLVLPMGKVDLEALSGLLPGSYEFKNLRETDK